MEILGQPFSTLLRNLRKRRKMSLEALANRAGVAERTLRYWESGERAPRMVELESVLIALEATDAEKQLFYAQIARPRAHRLLRTAENHSDIFSDIFLPHLGDLIAALRYRCGKTQEQVAMELEVSASTLMRWETMRSYPSHENILRLCALLNAGPAETNALVARDLTMPTSPPHNSDIHLLQLQYNSFISLIISHSHLVNLCGLSLMRHLILLPFTKERTRLLAQTQMTYSNILFEQGEHARAKRLVGRAMTLFQEIRDFGQSWVTAVNLTSTLVGKSKMHNAIKTNYLLRQHSCVEEGLPRVMLLCDTALYMSMDQKYEEAHRLMRRCEQECEKMADPTPAENYYHLTYGKINLKQNQPDLAYTQFAGMRRLYPTDPYYILFQAEAARQSRDMGECSQLIEQALAIVAETPFQAMRQRVHRMVEELSR